MKVKLCFLSLTMSKAVYVTSAILETGAIA